LPKLVIYAQKCKFSQKDSDEDLLYSPDVLIISGERFYSFEYCQRVGADEKRSGFPIVGCGEFKCFKRFYPLVYCQGEGVLTTKVPDA